MFAAKNLLFTGKGGKAAPSFDSSGSAYSGSAASGAGASWTQTIAGNALIVALSFQSASGATIVVKVGTTSLSYLGGVLYGNFAQAPWYYTYGLWGLLTPPTGSQTISYTVTGSGGSYGSGLSVSYSGVDSFGTVATAGITNSSNPSLTVPAAAGETVVGGFGTSFSSPGSYNQTQRVNLPMGSGHGQIIGDAPGASSVVFTDTLSGTSYWSGAGVPLIAA